MLALVKFVVPRIDAGYKAALKIQEKHQEQIASSLREGSQYLARCGESLALLGQSMAQLTTAVSKLTEQSQSHSTGVQVHQARVNAALKIP